MITQLLFNNSMSGTLVKIDSHWQHSVTRTKNAVGTISALSTLQCNGANTKFSDKFIQALWSEKLRYTTKISWDADGEMTMISETDLSLIGPGGFSGKCGPANLIKWYFPADSQKTEQPAATHGQTCGWGWSAADGGPLLYWYGPHHGLWSTLDLNSNMATAPYGGAHFQLPSYAVHGEQNCAWAWVK